ncbi:septal ring lytic transglycosylase RlpA family protein [bacterium]|nr:septal ring lytic transglycosylase RlpA family protein [bacterium]
MKLFNGVFPIFASFVLIGLSACGKSSQSRDSEADVLGTGGFSQTGWASYYGVGDGFNGQRTASGEIFNAYGLSAAHRTLRLGSCLMVTNLSNSKTVKVKVNDRGPYAGDRVLDLSYGAAKVLGVVSAGVARVRIESVSCSESSTQAIVQSNQTPVDNQNCKVYLTINSKTADKVNVTIQSRPLSGDELPCGKTIRINGSGSVAQSKVLNTINLVNGDGRLTAQLATSDLSGISHIFAESIDGEGKNLGQSEAKQLQLNASL